jgi:DNA-directed RNA polymerase subunit RPC12/RpoP
MKLKFDMNNFEKNVVTKVEKATTTKFAIPFPVNCENCFESFTTTIKDGETVTCPHCNHKMKVNLKIDFNK